MHHRTNAIVKPCPQKVLVALGTPSVARQQSDADLLCHCKRNRQGPMERRRDDIHLTPHQSDTIRQVPPCQHPPVPGLVSEPSSSDGMEDLHVTQPLRPTT